MVCHAVEQVDDPVRIQIQGRHLLPKPLGAVLVGPQKLGLHQLAGEPKDQLALLERSKAEGAHLTVPGPAPPPGARAGPGAGRRG